VVVVGRRRNRPFQGDSGGGNDFLLVTELPLEEERRGKDVGPVVGGQTVTGRGGQQQGGVQSTELVGDVLADGEGTTYRSTSPKKCVSYDITTLPKCISNGPFHLKSKISILTDFDGQNLQTEFGLLGLQGLGDLGNEVIADGLSKDTSLANGNVRDGGLENLSDDLGGGTLRVEGVAFGVDVEGRLNKKKQARVGIKIFIIELDNQNQNF
jgi:hypothetical protein